jgi:small subunit ribosomal protein S15
MSLDVKLKGQIIKKHATNPKDTGSPEVQVAVLTEKIKYLTEHMKVHPKDFHSRSGLLMMVSRRKKLLQYLRSQSVERYTKIIESLNLRGVK